jgi:hypothetical protein
MLCDPAIIGKLSIESRAQWEDEMAPYRLGSKDSFAAS